MQVGTLCALGTLCLDHEDHRRQLAEARVLAQIMRALDDPDAQARLTFDLRLRSPREAG